MGHVLASSTPASQETSGMNKWFTTWPALHPFLWKRIGAAFTKINLFCSFSLFCYSHALVFLTFKTRVTCIWRIVCLPTAYLLWPLFCGYCSVSGATDPGRGVAFNHWHSPGRPLEWYFSPLLSYRTPWIVIFPWEKKCITFQLSSNKGTNSTKQVRSSCLTCC